MRERKRKGDREGEREKEREGVKDLLHLTNDLIVP